MEFKINKFKATLSLVFFAFLAHLLGQNQNITNKQSSVGIDSSMIRVQQMEKQMKREAELRGIALSLKDIKFLDTAKAYTSEEKVLLKELFKLNNPKIDQRVK